jgi:hypothetical protein
MYYVICYYVRDVMLTAPDNMEFNLSANIQVFLGFVNRIINNRPYSKLATEGWR